MITGKVKRQDLFIVTKLPIFALKPSAVRPTVEQSLKNLCIDYLDLYLIHSPMGIEFDFKKMAPIKNDKDEHILTLDTDHIGVWREMEKLVDEGKIRSIGVSNFNSLQVPTSWSSAGFLSQWTSASAASTFSKRSWGITWQRWASNSWLMALLGLLVRIHHICVKQFAIE